jgi:hypothetical protein
MNKFNPLLAFQRWRTTRAELFHAVDLLRKENDQLRQKLAAAHQAKVHAEKQAEERRHEKDALREKLRAQKKAAESQELQIEQYGAKITELRAENDQLKFRKR